MNSYSPVTWPRIAAIAVIVLAPSLALLVSFFSNPQVESPPARRTGQPIPLLRAAPMPLPDEAHAGTAPDLAVSAAPVRPQPAGAAGVSPVHATGRKVAGIHVLPIRAAGTIGLATVLGWALLARKRSRRARSFRAPMNVGLVLLTMLPLAACGTSSAGQPAESPSAYLNGALSWMHAHSVFRYRVDWAELHRRATGMVRHPRTTTDIYPAIVFAVEQLRDGNAFFLPPNDLEHPVDPGFTATYPGRTVVSVEPSSPAAQAGLRTGDVIESINGALPRSFENLPNLNTANASQFHLVLHRPQHVGLIKMTFKGVPQAAGYQCRSEPQARTFRLGHSIAGYIDLPQSCRSDYVTVGQRVMRSADKSGTCGWIVDLRQNPGGDIWTYLATLGPIVGEAELGGFVYRDGRREAWAYRDGTVLWNGKVREESHVDGGVYRVKHPLPPLAVLTSHVTNAAGELVVVALHGRANTRVFGEPTEGFPNLVLNTPLSDGANLLVSGAFSFDRTGRTYRGPIEPDMRAVTDWPAFGTEQDPPMRAALRWLHGRPECAGS